MKLLTHLKPTELFAIEVPVDACKEVVINHDLVYYLDIHPIYETIPLPTGKWEILGIVTKDKISFDVEPYVKKGGLGTYKDYSYVDKELDEVGLFNALIQMRFKTPQESFYSLLAANGLYFINPLVEPQRSPEYYSTLTWQQEDKADKDLREWQQAEDNLVKKLLILKKI